MTDLFVFAGERSGDLHGAHLIADLKKNLPDLCIAGVAGPKMRECNIDCVLKAEHFETMGFLDIIPALPRLMKLFYRVKKTILKQQPKIVILIDYAEFNLRMAKALRKSGYCGKIIQLVSPTVWAWRKNRIHTMAENLDHVLCILPFEPPLFEKFHLPATYIGHPLLKEHLQTKHTSALRKKFNQPILAIFPGSRLKEIKRNLPIQIKAATALAEKHKLQPIISCAHAKFLKPILKLNSTDFPIVDLTQTHNLMQDAFCALATSGTITLQLALHGTPTCVNYAIGRLDQFIGQRLLRINLEHYALPNIIAGKKLFPEFYGTDLKVPALIQAMDKLIASPPPTADLHSLLKSSTTAADVVLNLLAC